MVPPASDGSPGKFVWRISWKYLSVCSHTHTKSFAVVLQLHLSSWLPHRCESFLSYLPNFTLAVLIKLRSSFLFSTTLLFPVFPGCVHGLRLELSSQPGVWVCDGSCGGAFVPKTGPQRPSGTWSILHLSLWTQQSFDSPLYLQKDKVFDFSSVSDASKVPVKT